MFETSSLSGLPVSILGCGWLGLPLAKKLVSAGAVVSGSTTSPKKLVQLQLAGIEPYLIDLRQASFTAGRFLSAQTVVIALPPKASYGNFDPYINQLGEFISLLETSAVEQVILVSSTGVYPENCGITTEEMAAPHSARAAALLLAEDLVQQLTRNRGTVLRLGGLFGPGRHPGRFLAGKTNVPNGNAPINFIHQADAVEILLQLIAQKVTGQVFHTCADLHPTRAEFYTKAAALANLPAPTFCFSETRNFTLINSAKIAQALRYRFLFPDPLAALSTIPVQEAKA